MKRNKALTLNILIVLILFVSCMTTACAKEESSEIIASSQKDQGKIEKAKKNNVIAISMFSSPAGMFNPLLYSDAYEANVIQFIFEALVTLDPQLQWEATLAKNWYFENENKTLVFELRDDVSWHDGTPFTAEDVKYTYSVLAHPDYTGVRQSYVRDLEGYEEYHAGQAVEFDGVEVVDQHKLKFHFKEPNVAALYRASFMIVPKHVYEPYDVKDLAKAKETLDFKKLIGTGPFKAETYLSNESYTLVKNENYWDGSPHINRLVWRVINQDVAPGLLENGEIDMITSPGGVRAADYDLVASIPQVHLYETPSFSYQYLGFKLNYRPEEDVKKKVIHPERFIPNPTLQSKELRQAIVYGINRLEIVDGLLSGRGTVINSPFISSSWAFDSSVIEEYPYDPGKANHILEQAGFVDKNGDGFRELPSGEKLILRLHYPTGDKVREQTALVIQRNLQDIGIHIHLHSPRDPGTHFSAIENDQENIDLFLGGWGLSAADPDPKAIWDNTSLWNFVRWNSAYQQELIDRAVYDQKSFDQGYRAMLYKEWAAYVNEELPYAFLYSVHDIHAYHERIKGVIESPTGIFQDIHKWTIEEAVLEG